MSTIAELEDKVKELMNEIETLKQQEKAEKFEYLFETGEQCWFISSSGSLFRDTWDTALISFDRYHQGNVFKTKEETERERDKRALLTKFRQFRDKCNGDWKPDFYDYVQEKYIIRFNYVSNELEPYISRSTEEFRLFGYFKNHKDCKRAIELFGDEIKRLFVEVEK